MMPDSAPASEARGDREVMAAVDSNQLVIADVSRDEAWLMMPESETATLQEWR